MSMIGCLLEISRKPGARKISEQDLQKTINKIANDDELLSLCKQALPTKSILEIKNYILDDDTYIDPRIFTDILEEYFNCKIYTFNKLGLIVPTYKKNYLHYVGTKKKIVVLIEHTGSECDQAVYPQCESLSYRIDDNVAEYYFTHTSIVATTLSSIFDNMTRSYFLNEKVEAFDKLPFTPVSQKFDSFGKVSAFTFNLPSENNVYIAYTKRPFPPLPIREMNDQDLSFPSIDQLRLYLHGEIKNGMYESDDFYIPINKSSKLVIVPKNTDSIIDTFNMFLKLSKYINEYFIFAYSCYIYDTKKEIGEKSISSFSKKNVVIDEDISYGIITKFFTKNNFIRCFHIQIVQLITYVTLRSHILRHTNDGFTRFGIFYRGFLTNISLF